MESQDGYIEQVLTASANRAHLKSVRVKNGIMKKALRNHPLAQKEKKRNRLISKIRYKVEQTFGTIKRKFKFVRASYIGLAKVQGQALLKASCYNLLKAANKVKLDLDIGVFV